MTALQCLEQAIPPEQYLFSDGVFSVVAVVVILAVGLAALASPLVRGAYRRGVTRLMGLDQVRPRPLGWWGSGQSRPAPDVHDSSPGAASDLQGRAARGEGRITRATVSAWLAFSLGAVFVAGVVNPALSWNDRLGFGLGAAVLAIGPVLINLPPSMKRRVLIAGLVAAAVLAGVLEALVPAVEETTDEDPLWLGVVALAVLGAVYFTLFRRRLRGLVLPLSLVASVWGIAFVLPIAALEPYLGSCLEFHATGGLTGQNAEAQPFWNGVFAVTGATLGLFGLWLGLRTVDLLARAVDRGWLGDQTLGSLIGLALIATALVLGLALEASLGTQGLAGLLPLPWLAVTAGAYVIALGPVGQASRGPQLLVLRVFSKDRRHQDLLDGAQARWRYLGPVLQVGGPDLVDLNIDPYECSMFLSSRLHELFLPEPANPGQLQGKLHSTADREGRFRVNEVFCFNTAWRGTVRQLMQLSDVILLDLRGLTAEREGTSYEISLLAGEALVSRVVALCDAQTDWGHVERLLRQAGADAQALLRLDLESGMGARELHERLLDAAAGRNGDRDGNGSGTTPGSTAPCERQA